MTIPFYYMYIMINAKIPLHIQKPPTDLNKSAALNKKVSNNFKHYTYFV